MTVYLVRPPYNDWYTTDQFKIFEGLSSGLLLLAKKLEPLDVKIIDGLNSSIDDVIERLDLKEGDYLGISSLYCNHESAVKLAEYGKSQGATIILGGQHASAIPERILENNESIDYIIKGYAEEEIEELIKGTKPLEDISGLVYRKDGKIISNKKIDHPITTLFDLELVEDLDIDQPVGTSFVRGCIKSLKKGKCEYCSIDDRIRLMHPKLAWKQIDILHNYGIKKVLEAGDTFFMGNYPFQLLRSRPDHLKHIGFARVYTTPNHITQANIDVMKKLNVECVFLGIEAYNDKVLKKANRDYKSNQVMKAFKMLKDQLAIQGTFMYGLSDESEETMQETYDSAKYIRKEFPEIRLLATPMIPLPGSPLFQKLVNNPEAQELYPGNLLKDDILNYGSLVDIQLKLYSSTNIDQVLELVEKTRNLQPKEGYTTTYHIKK